MFGGYAFGYGGTYASVEPPSGYARGDYARGRYGRGGGVARGAVGGRQGGNALCRGGAARAAASATARPSPTEATDHTQRAPPHDSDGATANTAAHPTTA